MPEPLPITLATPIQYARGVGPVRSKELEALQIKTAGDLLSHYPRDYIRYTQEKRIAELAPGEMATVRGEIVQTRMHRGGPGGRRSRFEALLEDVLPGDQTASPHAPLGRGIPTRARCVLTWFNPYGVADAIEPGMILRVTGKVTAYNGRANIAQPRYEVLTGEDAAPKDARIEPVYPASTELTSPVLAKLIRTHLELLLPQIPEIFDPAYLDERNFFTRRDAISRIHAPKSLAETKIARRTLAYHEFFLHQSAVAIKRYHARNAQPAIPLRVDDKVDTRIRALFEFPLTAAQNRVIESIRKDLAATKPMNRLLQGDVGSGKTVVALYAMLAAAATQRGEDKGGKIKDKGASGAAFEGHQGALMAPTEILAEQHLITLESYLEKSRVKYALLTGSMPAAEKKRVLAGLADGSIHLVVGTHALLSESVAFKSLALVVIDEQHKFGVEQRSTIRAKHGAPHTLVMTATPIPRTLAMTAFGDLDVSVIDELPPGRQTIHTQVASSVKRDDVYTFVAERLKAGEQAYVVLPAIDEGVLDIRSATTTQEELQKEWLKEFRVGLMHGRQEQQTRQHIMERFRQKLIDVLVSTTVIEVGVDVPNATVMVIEHADRFGLSQLHQLRGRVGRGKARSYCILVADNTGEDGIARTQAMVKSASGFAIAEEDLRLRGTGQLFGTAQSGRSEFHFADMLFDSKLLGMARRDAFATIAADPRLLDPKHMQLRQEVLAKFGQDITLADVG
jgi:ATP-dependent DNA helicase RecG